MAGRRVEVGNTGLFAEFDLQSKTPIVQIHTDQEGEKARYPMEFEGGSWDLSEKAITFGTQERSKKEEVLNVLVWLQQTYPQGPPPSNE